MIQEHCECGSSIRLCGMGNDALNNQALLTIWQAMHQKHEKVTAGQAQAIRNNGRTKTHGVRSAL